MNTKINRFLGMAVASMMAFVSLEGCKDSSSELAPAPELKSLTPNALTWAADETEPKTIEIEGTDLEGAKITLSELDDFYAELDGTTITVSPYDVNDLDENVINTLTVSLKGGKSLTATLTHEKPVRVPHLTALDPETLTWESGDTAPKTIEVTGEYLTGKVLSLTLTDEAKFTATVSGTTVTVTPKAANESDAAVTVTLGVSVDGGNSLTATLTHLAPVPVPALTGLTPNALTWAAAETDAKKVAVAGENLEGATITATVDGSAFTATVEGTTVTVTPAAANEGTADLTATLTVSVEGGNSLTATLTQAKPIPVPALTSLTPNMLVWAANSTEAKTVTVAGENLEGKTLSATVEGTGFIASVEGTTVTVTPAAANEGTADVTATLTVSVEGGNSLTATLTQTKPDAQPVPVLTSLTPDALTWAAAETDAKTVTVAGDNLEGVEITATVDGTAFTATVEGTTVTVTPAAANETAAAVTATLTVAVAGGNSLTATLAQEAKPVPALTSLTPDALTWAAAETDAKTVAVAGENLEGATITATVDGTAFTATVEGTTVTVTPAAANEGTADVTATLTVSVEGGNSLTATLTQTKPESVTPQAGTWRKVTDDRDDWSGTYLFVAEVEAHNPRVWNNVVSPVQGNMFFVTVVDNCITTAGTANMGRVPDDGPVTNNGDIALSDLSNYAVTIAKVDGGYSIMVPGRGYIYNADGVAGTATSDVPVVSATTITKSDDNTFWIESANTSPTTRYGWFNANRAFNYFPENKWTDKSQISFYEYVTE